MPRFGHLIALAVGVIATLALTSSPRPTHVRSLLPSGMREEYVIDAQGLVHGEFRAYHPSGRLAIVQQYSHGVAIESSRHFEDDGELVESTTLE